MLKQIEKRRAEMRQMTGRERMRRTVLDLMNLIVLVLSLMLIVWISVDTFDNVNFLANRRYMTFQLWVCIVFMGDFFIELALADNRWRMFRNRILFLILSVPYLNIIDAEQLQVGSEALYFLRFIPLARGALALSIVMGYLSKNAVSSLFYSYISILVFVVYFCSMIFYQMEHGINPEVKTYWTALWWTAMNVVTVGSNIIPVTVSGKIVGVILPIAGMIIFPLFTVYLTDYVRRHNAGE